MGIILERLFYIPSLDIENPNRNYKCGYFMPEYIIMEREERKAKKAEESIV